MVYCTRIYSWALPPHVYLVSTGCHWRDRYSQTVPAVFALFRLCVLYWTQTEEQKKKKQGGLGTRLDLIGHGNNLLWWHLDGCSKTFPISVNNATCRTVHEWPSSTWAFSFSIFCVAYCTGTLSQCKLFFFFFHKKGSCQLCTWFNVFSLIIEKTLRNGINWGKMVLFHAMSGSTVVWFHSITTHSKMLTEPQCSCSLNFIWWLLLLSWKTYVLLRQSQIQVLITRAIKTCHTYFTG